MLVVLSLITGLSYFTAGSFSAGSAPLPAGQEQDSSISCFYCHMNVIVETKAKAPKHWRSEVRCQACHGTSMEHIDAEDNSIKPEKLWNDSNVHELCRGCHSSPFVAYRESRHAQHLLSQEAAPARTGRPSCSSCHGFHGLRSEPEIMATCRRCHQQLPKRCESSGDAARNSGMNCKSCHNPHSLALAVSRSACSRPCEPGLMNHLALLGLPLVCREDAQIIAGQPGYPCAQRAGTTFPVLARIPWVHFHPLGASPLTHMGLRHTLDVGLRPVGEIQLPLEP